MKKTAISALFWVLIAAFLTGCAAAPRDLISSAGKDISKVPRPNAGESAVFGKVVLLENFLNRYLPAKDQAASIYINPTDKPGELTKISCSDKGEFGIYLAGGFYRVTKVAVGGFVFETDLTLIVPADQPAVYVGTLVFDGTPDGVEQGTGKSKFAFVVRDDQKDLESSVRKELPGVDAKFYRSIMKPADGMITGKYPSKVFRVSDVQRDLEARKATVEVVVGGVVTVIPYIINPVWIFTVH